MSFNHRLVEARFALRQVGFSELPAIAVEALEAGFDGPAIRKMAALVQPTGWETDELLPRFMKEANLSDLDKVEACIRLAVALTADILDQNRDPLPFLGRFERWFMQAEYPAEFQELGLIEEDAYAMQYAGASESEIRAWVGERLRAFLAAIQTI